MAHTPGKRRGETGVGFLEAAAFLTVLLTFLLGAIGLVDYLQQRRSLVELVDKQVRASAVKPLTMTSASRIEVNRASLSEYLRAAGRGIEGELRQRRPRDYFIEVLYAEVPIDPRTGSVAGPAQLSDRLQLGSAAMVPAELLNDTALERAVADLLSLRTGGHQSLLAAPSGLGSWTREEEFITRQLGEPDRYLPVSVVIAVRSFYRQNDGPGETLRRIAGLEPVFHALKVVPLRGDVDL